MSTSKRNLNDIGATLDACYCTRQVLIRGLLTLSPNFPSACTIYFSLLCLLIHWKHILVSLLELQDLVSKISPLFLPSLKEGLQASADFYLTKGD